MSFRHIMLTNTTDQDVVKGAIKAALTNHVLLRSVFVKLKVEDAEDMSLHVVMRPNAR